MERPNVASTAAQQQNPARLEYSRHFIRIFLALLRVKIMKAAAIGDEIKKGVLEWGAQYICVMPRDHDTLLVGTALGELERLRRKIEAVYIEVPACEKDRVFS